MGFSGTVGLEGFAAGDDVAALNAFRAAVQSLRYGRTGPPKR